MLSELDFIDFGRSDAGILVGRFRLLQRGQRHLHQTGTQLPALIVGSSDVFGDFTGRIDEHILVGLDEAHVVNVVL